MFIRKHGIVYLNGNIKCRYDASYNPAIVRFLSVYINVHRFTLISEKVGKLYSYTTALKKLLSISLTFQI